MQAPQLNDRRLIEAPLTLKEDRYFIDFDAFEKTIIENNVKLFLFCHPQNPSGRVWRVEELAKLAEICVDHQVVIVSDEIHADMTYRPNEHIPMATISPAVANLTVTLSSPGKTFNLGGLQMGYAIIADPVLKRQYANAAKAVSIYDLNLLGQVALQAAYSEQGKIWRDHLLTHFKRNIDILETFFKRHLPQVKVMRPEASYLVWLDFRDMFDNHQQLKKWLVEEAKLGLNDGETFGGESGVGTGFMRINLAVSSKILNQALKQIRDTPLIRQSEKLDTILDDIVDESHNLI